MNGTDCDISTLNSAFVLNHMANVDSFKELPLTIYNAPLDYQTPVYYNIKKTIKVAQFVEESQLVTGNTNADIQIGHRIYDIKHTMHTATTKSHVYPWQHERIENELSNFMGNLIVFLKSSKDPIMGKLALKLDSIRNSTGISWQKKNEIWNDTLSNYWDKLNPRLPLPLIVQMTSEPFTPKMPRILHEKIHVPNNVLENNYQAHKAICGIVHIYGKPYIENAKVMTEGVIDTSSFIPEDID